MSENIAQTVQKVIQDLVAPDLRELKALVSSNQKQTEVHLGAHDDKFTGLQKQIDQRFESQGLIDNANFKSLMAAISELKAQNELNTLQSISALSERVAVLESRQESRRQ